MTNQPDETLTTAQAAKLLGVRTDTVHTMKAEGHLTVVGKGPSGSNLFARSDIERVKIQRLKGRRSIPAQAELPSAEELTCDGCRSMRARVLAAEERAAVAEERAADAEGRAQRARAAMDGAINAVIG
jgi:DNA-binding transcriptional MerR regulator